jgi:uncharacterized membrane protein
VYHSRLRKGALPPSIILLRRAFIGASIAWAAALPLASFAASRPHNGSFLYLCIVAVYGIGSAVCHQNPARSFHLWAAQMPVCARCTGIYAGAAIAAIVGLTFARPARLYDSDAPLTPRTVVALAAIPTVATLAYEWTTGTTPSNSIRAAAGACLGAAVAIVVLLRPPARDREVN